MDKITIGEQEFETSKVIEALNGTGAFEVFTPDQINTKFGSLHEGYEKAFKEITGIEKNGSEKGIDFIRRGSQLLANEKTELSTSLDGMKILQSELEEKVKSGSNNELLKQTNEDLLSKISTLSESLNSEKLNFKKELSLRDNKQIVSNTLASFKGKLKADADKYGIQYIEERLIAEALKFGVKKNEKGDVILLNEQGVARLNDDMTPISLNSLASQMYEPYIEKKKNQTGAGTSGAGSGGSLLPSNLKTRVEVDEWLSSKESGIQKYSKEWVKLRQEARSLPIE